MSLATMALVLTIAGVDVVAADLLDVGRGTPAFDETLQARGLFRFTTKDRTGAYRPALGAEVIAELDGVRIWGGRINAVRERDWGDYVGNWNDVEVGDFTTPLETIMLNGIIPGPTLRDLLTQLLARFPPGYAVHPLMAAGPTLGPQGYGFKYVREALDDLGAQSGWSWTVDHYKQIWYAETGTIRAPVDFLADNETINAITIEDDYEGYVNAQWLHFGSGGPREVTDTWHGDGSTRLFPVTFPQPEGIVTPPPTAKLNGADKPIGVWGVDSGLEFYWRASDAALIQDFSLPVLTPADTLVATYVATFPGAVHAFAPTSEIEQHGEHAKLDVAPDVFDVAQAQQLCDGLRRQRGGLARRVRITTHAPGVVPGMSALVQVPERDLYADCLCLARTFSHDGRFEDGTDYWKFDLELVNTSRYVETWQKFWRREQQSQLGQSASGSVGPPPSGGGGGGDVINNYYLAGATYAGGSRTVSSAATTAFAWAPIAEFVDVLLTPGAVTQWTCRCHAWTVAGGSVTVRVLALEATNVVVGTGPTRSAVDWADPAAFVEFPFTLRPTAQYYRVEVSVGAHPAEAYVAGCVFYPVVT